MAKGSRGGKAGSATAQTAIQQNNQQQSSVLTARRQQRMQALKNGTATAVPQAFRPLTQTQTQQMAAQQDLMLAQSDINVRYAIKQYIRRGQMANGFSRSQNLNNKLQSGAKLDQTEQKMVKYMDAGMQQLKQNTLYSRADHALTSSGTGLMQRLGVANYQNMTNAQLSAALTGKTFTENKYVSVSTDVSKNVFISGNQSGGRSVMMTIKAPSGTKYIVGDTSQAEHVLGRGQNYRITGARFTGKTAYPQKGSPLKQIALEVEII